MWFVKYKFSCKQHDGVCLNFINQICPICVECFILKIHVFINIWPHHLRYLCRLQTLQTQLWSIKKTFVLFITKEREDQWIVVWACKKQMNRFFFFVCTRNFIQVNELFFVCEPTKDFIFCFQKRMENKVEYKSIKDWWFLYACFYNC